MKKKFILLTKIYDKKIRIFFYQIKNGGPNSGSFNLGGLPVKKDKLPGPPVGHPWSKQTFSLTFDLLIYKRFYILKVL